MKKNVKVFRMEKKGKYCHDCGKAIKVGKMVVTVSMSGKRAFLHANCFNKRNGVKVDG